MGAIIKQYEGSSVSPKDDAIMHEIFNDQSGVIRGCEIVYLGSNQIKVGEGYLYICGRVIQIEEEVVFCKLTTEKTEGELILKIDLLAETPARLMARNPREQLIQGNINGADSVFEYLLATYTVSDVTISGLNPCYEYITAGFTKDRILATKEEINAVTEPGFLADALAMKECFQSVSNGKALVASAITDKGVNTASDAAFATMANNIKSIKDVANNTQATATAADITAGKTAWVNGKLIPGTRPLPVNKQSGSVTFMVAAASSSGSKTTDYLVRFTAAFEKVPSVTAAATSLGQHFTVSTFNVTQTSFYIRVVNHTLYGSQEVTFNWVAQSQ